MYYLYEKKNDNGIFHYSYKDNVKIFGSVNGLIVKMLKQIIPNNQNESYKWRINIDNDLPKISLANHAILIDLKPNTEGNISLYEIKNIFGHCASGWTPMMFHLKAIFVDEEGEWEDKESFIIDTNEPDDIYTFHHV